MWLKVDDRFATHEKVMRLDDEFDPRVAMYARAVWLTAGVTCAQHVSPVVDLRLLRRLLPAPRSEVDEAVGALVSVGLFDREDDEIVIHDWGQLQSKDATNAERQKRHREKRKPAPSEPDKQPTVAVTESNALRNEAVTPLRNITSNASYPILSSPIQSNPHREIQRVRDAAASTAERDPVPEHRPDDVTADERGWAWPLSQTDDLAWCPAQRSWHRFEPNDLAKMIDSGLRAKKIKARFAWPASPQIEVALDRACRFFSRESEGRKDAPIVLAAWSFDEFFSSEFAKKYEAEHRKPPPVKTWIEHVERNVPWLEEDDGPEAAMPIARTEPATESTQTQKTTGRSAEQIQSFYEACSGVSEKPGIALRRHLERYPDDAEALTAIEALESAQRAER